MAEAARGSMVRRPSSYANEEQRAIHSWSRISSAGHNVLLDALKILSPMTCDLSSTEDLVTFLQELSDEGHKPSILRSKDIYGYRSCMSQPMTQDMLRPPTKSVRPTAKRRGKKSLNKKVHPSWNSSDRTKPRIQGVRPPELLMDHRTVFCSRMPSSRTVEPMDVQQCLRLTNIEGLSGFHTARLQIHTSWDSSSEAPSVGFTQQQQLQPLPPAFSGIPCQPSQNGGVAPTNVALFSQKSLSCPIKLDGALIGDSAPVFCANGRSFPQTHTELTSNGWRSNGVYRCVRRSRELSQANGPQRNGWKEKNSLKWKVIKVDESRSVDDACRKAQKILQVNLCPVIQIQPLNHVLRDFRYQNQK